MSATNETLNPGLVRRMWQTLEPLHALNYYSPEMFKEAEALGYAVHERWPAYFAMRAAALGAASAELVTSTFYSFSPAMVARYVPRAWEIADPTAVLAARLRAADATLRATLGERLHAPEIAEAAALTREAAEAADTAGRPLAAAHAALPWASEPHLVLWQAITRLREHRGDGHIAALVTHRLDGVEALVSHSAAGAAPAEIFASRQWSAEEWDAARERLAARGWLAADGTATEAGRTGRDSVEALTDELAAQPWQAIGATRAAHLADLILPAVMDAIGTGLLPMQSTLGIGMTYPHQT
ncbi:SCO6745 family protein [Embleya sp. NPDC001921]